LSGRIYCLPFEEETMKKWSTALTALACLVLWVAPSAAVAAGHRKHHQRPRGISKTDPNLGSNVIIFTPSMSQAAIQSELDTISTQQVPNQFGPQRYAIFFEPGTYGSAADPLDFQVGFYTQVAGLGAEPGDVVINGTVNVFNQCSGGQCEGTDNFWRSLSDLTLNVDLPSTPPNYAPSSGDPYGAGCQNSADIWAVSQAAPMRNVIINGNLVLQDYCGGSSPPNNDVSGGYMANDQVSGALDFYGQQQFFVRNSDIGSSSNYVWNMVFMGDNGAPATDFGVAGGQYTNLASSPVSEEEPYLYTSNAGSMRVFVPAVQRDSVGPSYASGSQAGKSVSISRFFVANPSTPVAQINAELARGRNLILTPGVYDLSRTIVVRRPDTIVLGLGFATLVPQNGNEAIRTADVPGIKLSGMIFDAGPQNSPVLLELGSSHGASGRAGHARGGAFAKGNNPTLAQDIFFRVGGAEPGKATVALVVNDSNTILDDVWAWRADHGAGVGWTDNTSDTGLIVNGNNVRAYGLAVEHFQKNEVIWNGQNGEDVFFQNEMPYDPPSLSAWMASPSIDGYPSFLVSPNVKSFQGYGMGSYSFFDQGVPIYASQAFTAPDTPGVQLHDLLTVFLNATQGQGGIDSVIDGVGGSSTAANPDVAVDVTSYP
jgi:hypothetical protein